ncbi:hypothetical protein Tco_0963364 [Tanacetum coccineum]
MTLPPLQRGGSLEEELFVYLAELIKKKKQVGLASSLGCEARCEAVLRLKNSNKDLLSASFLEENIIPQEVSGRAVKLKEIQDEDTSPSKNTGKIPLEVEGFKPPQEEVVPIYRSVRTHRSPGRLCQNVEVEEHTLRLLLEEIHVTWAHLKKKPIRLQLYTKSDKENAYSGWRWRHDSL